MKYRCTKIGKIIFFLHLKTEKATAHIHKITNQKKFTRDLNFLKKNFKFKISHYNFSVRWKNATPNTLSGFCIPSATYLWIQVTVSILTIFFTSRASL